MRIHAMMCVRNEAARYLDSSLSWHVPEFDSFFVYDDQSDDDTSRLLSLYTNVSVVRRPHVVPSFIQHEGDFRQSAFDAFEETICPSPGDWVMALDADEFAVAHYSRLGESLRASARAAEDAGATSLVIRIPEVWNLDPPMIRTDGHWAGLAHPRLFRYLPPVNMSMKTMGGGSAPLYVHEMKQYPCNLVSLLHYGYADPADVQKKYRRYSSMNHGHNSAHIESIVAPPTLADWDGPVPKVWKGIRG